MNNLNLSNLKQEEVYELNPLNLDFSNRGSVNACNCKWFNEKINI